MLSAVIPAYNEQDTIAEVVRPALSVCDEVVVVSDGSADQTAARAREAGARVLELSENLGKGGALLAGLQAARGEVVLMLDADLVGLTPEHLSRMLQPVVRGELGMAIGVFEGGGFVTDFGNKMTPHLSGQRAVRRDWLLTVPRLGQERWPEPAITDHLRRTALSWGYVQLPELKQVLKETKRGFWQGLGYRARMYWEILSYRKRRRADPPDER